MQAYTRLTAQRRFSFRTKHHELNTRLYGQVFSRILDQWPSRCSTETVYEEAMQRYGFTLWRAEVFGVILPPGGPKLNSSRKPDLPDTVTFAIQNLLTWRPAEVNSLVDLCSSQDGCLRVA
jgi:hypothetical protein